MTLLFVFLAVYVFPLNNQQHLAGCEAREIEANRSATQLAVQAHMKHLQQTSCVCSGAPSEDFGHLEGRSRCRGGGQDTRSTDTALQHVEHAGCQRRNACLQQAKANSCC